MRTTVAIEDRLLAAAKTHAARRGQTLGQFVEDALRMRLASHPEQTPVELPVFTRGTGARPGVDLTTNRGLLDALDDAGDPT